MLLPREIAKFVQASELDAFAPDACHRLEHDPGADAIRRLAAETGQAPGAVLLAVQVARVLQASTLVSPAAEFVATVPAGTPCPARPTAVVLREMLSGIHQEIMALGYEISDESFVNLLVEAALFCPALRLLCDRERGSARRLRERWPRDRNQPAFYENIEVRDPPLSSMHCKALLVDARDLLVTSANFTFHGLSGNIEFGVRLRGEQAQPARDIFLELLRSGLFRPANG